MLLKEILIFSRIIQLRLYILCLFYTRHSAIMGQIHAGSKQLSIYNYSNSLIFGRQLTVAGGPATVKLLACIWPRIHNIQRVHGTVLDLGTDELREEVLLKRERKIYQTKITKLPRNTGIKKRKCCWLHCSKFISWFQFWVYFAFYQFA